MGGAGRVRPPGDADSAAAPRVRSVEPLAGLVKRRAAQTSTLIPLRSWVVSGVVPAPGQAWRCECKPSVDEDSAVADLDRRSLLKLAALGPLAGLAPRAAPQTPSEKPDLTLRIATGLVELSPDHILSTTLYNNQFPGPLLRFTEGERVVIDLQNDTDVPEQVHWHGQAVPVDVDGAAEEGTPFVPAHGTRRISFVPRPAGFRFVHTHVMAGPDLARGTYTGQVCPVYIEPRDNAGAYDREVFIVMKEFAPSWSRGGDMPSDMLAGSPSPELKAMGKAADDRHKGPKGFEVGYELFSINGRARGHGDPIRVNAGERVLFHVLKAS